jgi:starch synthase (maltosyl-transferring)
MTAPQRSGARAAQPKTSGTTSTKNPKTGKVSRNAARSTRKAPADNTEPPLFGRVNILDVTPSQEDDCFPARVELGETITVSAQVFVEGRAKVGATAVCGTRRVEWCNAEK